MKKKILIVYDEMVIGGSTTSLLSILNLIDYKRYDVDLLLYYNSGPLISQIPKQVNVLNQACLYSSKAKRIKLIRSILNGDIQRALFYGIIHDRKIKLNKHAMVYARITNSRRLKMEYDVAIGFLEGWANNYVALKVKAKKKIGWIHPDPKNSNVTSNIDYKVYKLLDSIILVSEKCMNNFNEIYPEFITKTDYIENILSQETVRNISSKYIPEFSIDKSKINLVTVCRIDFKSKGLDRGIKAFAKLKEEGLGNNFHWYIVGDGIDMDKLRKMITDYNLERHITSLGSKTNPLPYVSLVDMFFLPSRYEGKPMSVTEAQMVGIPALVTAYASAHEQINNGIDGIIVENTDEAIYLGLKELSNCKGLIERMKYNTYNHDYSNNEVINKIYKILS